MESAELRNSLNAIGVSQADFARLADVTPRAISLWLAGDRSIPGAVAAYVRLLQSLPAHMRQAELARLNERKNLMREGMYAIEYRSMSPKGIGEGSGIMILENGRAYGADPWGGKYDGGYVLNEGTGQADIRLKITFPPNRPAVFGVSHPYEWAIEVNGRMDMTRDQGVTRVATPIGPHIDVAYKYLRSMPDA